MTIKRQRLTSVVVMFLGVGLLAGIAEAGRKEDLRANFAGRYPAIGELKTAGKLGETFQGYVEVVQKDYLNDPKIKTLMTDENADRGELYRLLAQETGATPEDVAARNAARNFKKVQPGEYLKHADGAWRKKG